MRAISPPCGKNSCRKGSLPPAKKQAVYLSCQKRQPNSPVKMAAYPKKKKKKQKKKKKEEAEEEEEQNE